MKEPSVLDYVKSILTPWKGERIPFPPAEEKMLPGEEVTDIKGPPEAPELQAATSAELEDGGDQVLTEKPSHPISVPWLALIALAFALAGQSAFAPLDRQPEMGLVLLIIAFLMAVWGYFRKDWSLSQIPKGGKQTDPFTVKITPFTVGGVLAFLAFLASGGGQFSSISVIFLAASLIFFSMAFWEKGISVFSPLRDLLLAIKRPLWSLTISRWSILLLVVSALILFYRFHQLGLVPPEMVSDHAEKYMDVNDILSGQTWMFFPRNGGREALQFYLLAFMNRNLGLPQDHLTLKISTAFIGILALPFVYLAGKEIANRRVGLIALTFSGIAYWTNVVSRAGMRLPFYFLFTAATLYYLFRGIRTGSRNSFIVSGLFLGLSAYGYSADRILPIVVVAAVGLYLLHRQSKGVRKQTIWQTLLLALMAVVVFLPLLRYWIFDPNGFSGRMLSRMGGAEQPIPGSAIATFFNNLWRALAMFSGSNGVVWGVSIPDYPALNIVAGGLFYLGVFLIFIRYIHKRHWLDLFLLLSIPLLMLPSILSLAFPVENPNLYRTGGAVVPVFILIGIALDSLMTSLETRLERSWGRGLAWTLLLLLLAWSAIQDYDLVFDKFYRQYRLSAWNYTEMGNAIRTFSETSGSPETAWLMGYPHWADARLVAINAGNPEREYAMFVDQLESTKEYPQAKLFILHVNDSQALEALPQHYPEGWFQIYKSSVESKDFVMFFVPPDR